MIPFAPPYMDEDMINAVVDTLRSGWITTGPKTRTFEKMLATYCGSGNVLCLNSATSGLELMLRWFGIGEGDEVIIPAYTYAATGNVVVHCGAKPVFADVDPDLFLLNADFIKPLINERTKAIIPVDFAGLPADYPAIMKLVNDPEIRSLFQPRTQEQQKLNRLLVMADAAHALGARINAEVHGNLPDLAVFSFHAVKNLSTAEGGAVAFNLPLPFDNNEVYTDMLVFSLHGQNKDALSKMQKGNWRYDIISAGYKYNMTDISAALGIEQLKKYETLILPAREKIMRYYTVLLHDDPRFILPDFEYASQGNTFRTSWHLYTILLKPKFGQYRDDIIKNMAQNDMSLNVHFLPLAGMNFYKKSGYNAADYPISLSLSNREISLPVFFGLSENQQEELVKALKTSFPQE